MTYTATSSDTTKATVSVSGSTLTLTGKTNGATTITVTANDGSASVSQTFSQTVTTNRAPTVTEQISAKSVRAHSTLTFKEGKFADADGDSLTVTVSSADTQALQAKWSSTYTDNIELKGRRMGATRVTLTATDGYLTKSTGFDVTVTQRNGQKPVTTVGSISDQSFDVGDSAVTIDVEGKFSDGNANDTPPDVMKYTASSSATGVATASVSGTTLTLAPVAGGSATITVTADDGQGSSANQTFTATVNRAPTASGTIPTQSVSANKGNRTINVDSYFSDADGDTLTYTAASSDSATATASVSDSNVTVSGVAVGSATITVTASDGSLSATQSIPVTVTLNQAPIAVGGVASRKLGLRASARTINVSGAFSDPDGDSLSYTAVSSDTSKATVSASGTNVTVSSLAVGKSTITVTASDGAAVATQVFTVTVIPNRSPSLRSAMGSVSLRVPSGYVGHLHNNFSEPDGDPLTYSVSDSNPGKIQFSLSGSKLTIFGKRMGSTTLTVTVSDGLVIG